MLMLKPTPNTVILLLPSNGKIIADIKHNYGDYLDTDAQGNEVTRNNTGFERLTIHSNNMSYAKKRALVFWSNYF